jgi:hypothetical protein
VAEDTYWSRVRRWSVSRRRLLGALVAGGAAAGLAEPKLRSRLGARSHPLPATSLAASAQTLKAASTSSGVQARKSARGWSDPTAVQAENARQGATNWHITNFAGAGEIQAYAGQTSVNAGETLDLYVSTKQARTAYHIDFYRMGWYGGAGARLVSTATGRVGRSQGYYTGATGLVGSGGRQFDQISGLLDVNWAPTDRLHVPPDWISGFYLALLTDAGGKQTYVPFVVRQDFRSADFLYKAAFNTYQAYNAWGGKSLYADNSNGAKTVGGSSGAVKVSFNRPYDSDYGSGDFLRYEYNLVRWIERMGYDVTYVADEDVASNPDLLHGHKAFISSGHDEYWTAPERRNVEKALDHGMHMAFISGDAVYWQARYEPSVSGDQNRTLVVYRGSADPLYASDPSHATVRWCDPPLNRPQHMLTGTVYAGQTEPFTQDWVVHDTSSWLFTGTDLKPGDRVAKLIGKEFDRAPTDMLGPPGLQILSHSPITVPAVDRPPNVAYAESTIYTAASGATVFSAANVTWSWGLDGESFPIGALHDTPVSAPIQKMTRNLFDHMAAD